ncbi:TetR/AcrR family transcriptional regulator [Xanthomonas sp. A2111]|uniref:TetR/AcrR family transcriptional regulator n=1 Tax=Xanthomonas hawaiiensis TaxID=3003247 RepID=A0ABU2I0K8_9XANT|nr:MULTISPECIES: TetR/AcrR family transcriptional regulator [unclassified Xanthomonas]MBO9830204.1 TetR/AcrR family transcriptional regulator [Xanthomonas sp. A2111]MBO9874785.1 TetR/AcrR family transcriptional regulator [Xanthomonas sp. D-93]MDS9991676.1 TetR/AcrR family transcriptional regulator [Xanthomonas sp. A2111]WNH43495.1 TetR/AcrR family transcriptional regulator [Xanthomonas sp. A6251]
MRVRTEAKRDAIIQAAAAVFLEAGFEGASMSQIATRAGSSKRTLYGYFPSKEELFVAVAHSVARRFMEPVLETLLQSQDALPTALQRMGEDGMAFLCSQQSVQVWQTVIGVSGRSDIGLLFFETGPGEGMNRLGVFLERQMDLGVLRRANPSTAARHLVGLLEAETLMPCLFGALKNPSPDYLRAATRDALQVFFGGYAAQPAP